MGRTDQDCHPELAKDPQHFESGRGVESFSRGWGTLRKLGKWSQPEGCGDSSLRSE